jgi:hypothetical protein
MKMSMGAPSSGPKMSAHRSVVDVGEEAKDKKPFKLVAAGLANNGAKRPERGGSQVRLHHLFRIHSCAPGLKPIENPDTDRGRCAAAAAARLGLSGFAFRPKRGSRWNYAR